MSVFSNRFALVAELVGLSLIAVALWFVSPIVSLLFVGIILILVALGQERKE